MLFLGLEWAIALAVLTVAAIVLPGLIILKAIFRVPRLKPAELLLYATGIGLVAVPLGIYWSNYFGLTINAANAILVLIILSSLAITINLLFLFLGVSRKKSDTPSRKPVSR